MITLPPYVLTTVADERVDYELPDFRNALVGKSVRLWWEGATTCPCRKVITNQGKTESTGEPRGDCLACKGSGIAYDEGQQTIGMLLGVGGTQQRFNEFGPNEVGYGHITFLPENLPGTDDRLTLFDGWRIHTEMRQRLDPDPEAMRYPIQRRKITVGSGPSLTTPLTRTVGVLHGRYTNAAGVVQSTVLVEGTHLTVTTGGLVDFTLGDGLGVSPPVGGWYSLRYFCRPVFVVVDHVFVRRDIYNRTDGADLALGSHPVAALVMAEHLGNRNPPAVVFNPSPTWSMKG